MTYYTSRHRMDRRNRLSAAVDPTHVRERLAPYLTPSGLPCRPFNLAMMRRDLTFVYLRWDPDTGEVRTVYKDDAQDARNVWDAMIDSTRLVEEL